MQEERAYALLEKSSTKGAAKASTENQWPRGFIELGEGLSSQDATDAERRWNYYDYLHNQQR